MRMSRYASVEISSDRMTISVCSACRRIARHEWRIGFGGQCIALPRDLQWYGERIGHRLNSDTNQRKNYAPEFHLIKHGLSPSSYAAGPGAS